MRCDPIGLVGAALALRPDWFGRSCACAATVAPARNAPIPRPNPSADNRQSLSPIPRVTDSQPSILQLPPDLHPAESHGRKIRDAKYFRDHRYYSGLAPQPATSSIPHIPTMTNVFEVGKASGHGRASQRTPRCPRFATFRFSSLLLRRIVLRAVIKTVRPDLWWWL